MSRRLPLLERLEESARGAPAFELRAVNHGAGDLELEVWQVPSPATPQVKEPQRVAGLRGRNLALVESSVLKQLGRQGHSLAGLMPGERTAWHLDEDTALSLGLLFRTLAPMRSRANMTACAAAIEAMGREEAAYWLGMALHRKNPRRVLAALRLLLVEPEGGR